MRRIATTTAIVIAGIAAPEASALATAPPTTTPPDEAPVDTAASAELAPVTVAAELAPAGAEPVVYLDESGNERGTFTVAGIEPGWTGYAEGEEPDSGAEYLRITVVVESRIARGLFTVDAENFVVQDVDGFAIGAQNVRTPEQAAAEQEPVFEAELAEGETVEFALTFEMVAGRGPQALFYTVDDADYDRLVTLHEFEG